MKILLDNGHGFDTPGKRSPDGHFREYAYNRYLAFLIRERLSSLGLDCQLIVPEREDISLKERCRRVNAVCRQFGNDQVILICIHVNAAGNGQNWLDARGWSCFTTRGKTKADRASHARATDAVRPSYPARTAAKGYIHITRGSSGWRRCSFIDCSSEFEYLCSWAQLLPTTP